LQRFVDAIINHPNFSGRITDYIRRIPQSNSIYWALNIPLLEVLFGELNIPPILHATGFRQGSANR
jgi:hypothetical protein